MAKEARTRLGAGEDVKEMRISLGAANHSVQSKEANEPRHPTPWPRHLPRGQSRFEESLTADNGIQAPGLGKRNVEETQGALVHRGNEVSALVDRLWTHCAVGIFRIVSTAVKEKHARCSTSGAHRQRVIEGSGAVRDTARQVEGTQQVLAAPRGLVIVVVSGTEGKFASHLDQWAGEIFEGCPPRLILKRTSVDDVAREDTEVRLHTPRDAMREVQSRLYGIAQTNAVAVILPLRTRMWEKMEVRELQNS
mmetsp:Transcript_53009/g.141698  ORF Transcript_53009/g.141698 Transcript_53009/m.141698 type:complete len:251 (-) Transcript_53009:150-902(-)|eukprot:CAMPEP_0194547188 /NCGR_PEP_ID=MMETSP0253-20130528/91772_1 /TAXON_ID=2966 /ORGANISM="Noctiluca scintillans" /LENGTH=250 /DNA_ID=CAMNT_0039394361 /DNA_START=783 /DNA_END=1535 /DNA_ORIENTATION=-